VVLCSLLFEADAREDETPSQKVRLT